MWIKVINKSDNPLPKYETDGSAGMDLMADVIGTVTLQPMERILIPTGLHMDIPTGYEAQVRGRSGLAIKNGIGIVNGLGTIDSDYRGDIGVILINFGSKPFIINKGDKIAQLVISPIEQVDLISVSVLAETARGMGGYGHTGK